MKKELKSEKYIREDKTDVLGNWLGNFVLYTSFANPTGCHRENGMHSLSENSCVCK